MKRILFCIVAILLNLLGAWCTRFFALPLYLDSISTIAVAYLCGCTPSLAVALITNITMYFIFGSPLLFATCHIMTALGAWAIFKFAKKRMAANTKPQVDFFLLAGILSAITNGIFGSVYSIMLANTHQEVLVEGLSGFLMLITNSLPLSHLWSGIVTNLADKILSAMFSYLLVIGARKEGVAAPFVTIFSSSYLLITILIFIAIANIVSCFILQKVYRKISGTQPNLESSLYIMILASVILIAACFFIVYTKMIQVQKEKEVETTRRELSKRMSFDLHDGVLQNLVALKTRMETELYKNEKSPEIQLIQTAVSEIRILCGILRLNDEVPLEDSIKNTLTSYEQTYGFKTQLGIACDISFFTPKQKAEILHILYECLSNSAQHSNAKNVEVVFSDNGTDKIYFTVRDDGKTEMPKETLKQVQGDKSVQDDKSVRDDELHGLGLKSIEARVKKLGGTVQFLQDEDGWTTRMELNIAD